ncbi:HNH endonuclease [Candidatus Poribacteria bacterium]|nr:HNH endonuclease [Candidatus Poribacteria bacterium]
MNFFKILPSLLSRKNLKAINRFLSELGQVREPDKSTKSVSKSSEKSDRDVSKELRSILWDLKRDNYRVYLNSKEWKAKRRKVLKMAGYRCRKCGATATEVHHETYKRIFNEKITDLTALCSGCHRRIHNRT